MDRFCQQPSAWRVSAMTKSGASVLALSALLLTLASSGSVAEVDLSTIVVPDGYEESGEDTPFVRSGDGASALAAAIPNHQYSASFMDDWFFDGAVAVMDVSSMPLPEGITTEREAHQSLAGALKARWGEHSFSLFDPEAGVGRFVNYSGAFVALSWRKVGGELVVVESMDLVEVLVAESAELPDTSDPEILWQHFKNAANAEDVDRVLSSLKPEP